VADQIPFGEDPSAQDRKIWQICAYVAVGLTALLLLFTSILIRRLKAGPPYNCFPPCCLVLQTPASNCDYLDMSNFGVRSQQNACNIGVYIGLWLWTDRGGMHKGGQSGRVHHAPAALLATGALSGTVWHCHLLGCSGSFPLQRWRHCASAPPRLSL
jgi:hypothetical protein